MSAQPEALRLADWRDTFNTVQHRQCAAELRQLHQLAIDQQGEIYVLKMARSMEQKTAALKLAAAEAQCDALLEVLRKIGRYTGEGPMHSTPWQDIVADLGQLARAAIKAVEEGE